MGKIRIGELRDHASRYVGRASKGETFLVLNRNRPVATLGPAPGGQRRGARLLGCLRGTAEIVGDIVETSIPERDWFHT